MLELLALFSLVVIFVLRFFRRSMGLCQSKPLEPAPPATSVPAADKPAPAPAAPAANGAAAAAGQGGPAPLFTQPALTPHPNGVADSSKPIDLSQASGAVTASAATSRWPTCSPPRRFRGLVAIPGAGK
jgi:hypothetical protein